MAHLCKIELAGRVGAVHEQIVGNERLVRFSVGVDTVYRGGAGSTVQTSWFNCTYWGNCDVEKGKDIHIEGRMVGHEYAGQDGIPRMSYEVEVNKIW